MTSLKLSRMLIFDTALSVDSSQRPAQVFPPVLAPYPALRLIHCSNCWRLFSWLYPKPLSFREHIELGLDIIDGTLRRHSRVGGAHPATWIPRKANPLAWRVSNQYVVCSLNPFEWSANGSHISPSDAILCKSDNILLRRAFNRNRRISVFGWMGATQNWPSMYVAPVPDSQQCFTYLPLILTVQIVLIHV